jgi:hypothetical protein
VTAPAAATFGVAEGPVPAACSAASIQWQQSTDGGSSWSGVAGSNVTGATSPTLRIAPTSAAESGRQFRAVLTNAHGSSTSAAAALTVGAEPSGPAGSQTAGPPSDESTGSTGGTGGGGSPSPSGGGGGSSATAPPASTSPSPKSTAPKSPTCKKGFQKKKVKGKVRCVKPNHKKKHKGHPTH